MPMSMLHVHVSILYVLAACLCCISVLNVHVIAAKKNRRKNKKPTKIVKAITFFLEEIEQNFKQI
jgi:hypothetical protein